MSLTIETCGSDAYTAIDVINQDSYFPLIYSSAAYQDFLTRSLSGSEFICLVVKEDDQPVGFIPLVLKSVPSGYAVVNSLPFFGSHGGPCFRKDFKQKDEATRLLMDLLQDITNQHNVTTTTLVEHPMNPMSGNTLEQYNFSVVDDRIGQITHLPSTVGNDDENLMKLFHVKTRNAIRKGMRQDMHISRSDDLSDWQWLHCNHASSITAMGGVAKSWEIFQNLRDCFPADESSRLYVGRIDEKIEVALLILFYDLTVEYFTPVVSEAFKNQQILSALIVFAMREVVEEGSRHWNWGGTWRSQEGVYRFKARFGAKDYPYRYFHCCHNPVFQTEKPENIRNQFPYFYTHRY